MPRKTVYHGEVDYIRILDEQGHLDTELAAGTLSDVDVQILYQQMIVCREFDETAFKLQRSGRMGTFPQNKGQEAVALGAAKALTKGVDYIVPYYRENPALFLHGLPMHYVLLHWMGDERGNAVPRNLSMNPSVRRDRGADAACGGNRLGIQATKGAAGCAVLSGRRGDEHRRFSRSDEPGCGTERAMRLLLYQQPVGDFSSMCQANRFANICPERRSLTECQPSRWMGTICSLFTRLIARLLIVPEPAAGAHSSKR